MLLMLFSATASAFTNISSFTTTPTSVAPGETVVHTVNGSTNAETLSGTATVTLLRDGIEVQTQQFPGFLDALDIGNGIFQETFSLPANLYATPGNYEVQLDLDGFEDGSTPVAESASTTFSVVEPVAVTPTSLSLTANPGQTATGTFTVTAGNSPFSLSTISGTLSQTSANVGDTITYSLPVDASAAPGTELADDITVTPTSGQPVIIPVTVTVTEPAQEPIVVSPPSLSLQGAAGESPTATFTITSGIAPFQLASADAEGRGSFSNAMPGLNETVTYSYRLPGSLPPDPQPITDTITVTGSDGSVSTVIATITPIVDDGGSPIEGLLQDLAPTEAAREAAAVIEVVCPSGTAEARLQEDCNAVVGAALGSGGTAEEAAVALGQITTDQASSSVDASQVRMRGQINNIGSRINALRGGAVGLSTRGLALNLDGQSVPVGQITDAMLRDLQRSNGGAASSDGPLDFGRLGVFINGSIASGDRDETTNSAGYDIDTVSVTLGADYRFTDSFVAGAAVGYTSGDTDIDSNGGNLDSDGYNFSLYGTYFQDSGLYVDGVLTYGSSDYDQRRNIRYTLGSTVIDQEARASFDGSEWSASIGGGYQMSRGALTFGPTARIEYIKTDVDGYDETMSNPTGNGGGWATHINSQDLKSFTSKLGGEVSYAVSTSWGVLLPSAQVEWVHEFEDNAGNVSGFYLQDTSQTAFSLATDDLDQNYYNLTLGVSAQFAEGRTGYISFRKLFGYDDLDVHSVNAGLRMEF
jgi:outer membrane autotransporter protein